MLNVNLQAENESVIYSMRYTDLKKEQEGIFWTYEQQLKNNLQAALKEPQRRSYILHEH